MELFTAKQFFNKKYFLTFNLVTKKKGLKIKNLIIKFKIEQTF